jgi:hypothetical protein
MRTGRPRTPIGTHGAINTRREGRRVVAETRVRDLDGRLRQVRGTSQLRRTKPTPQALTLEQITAIRKAAATWRSEPGLPGPRPDGQIRDIIEVLLGTAMRIGECSPCVPAISRTCPPG